MGDLSKASAKHHIKTAGLDRCPFCKIALWQEDVDDFEYGDLEPVENGDIEQDVKCNHCGKRWKDVFRLAEIHELC